MPELYSGRRYMVSLRGVLFVGEMKRDRVDGKTRREHHHNIGRIREVIYGLLSYFGILIRFVVH